MHKATLLIVLLICLVWITATRTVPIEVAGRKYNVVGRYHNKKRAAEIFALLHNRMMILMTHLKRKYIGVIDYNTDTAQDDIGRICLAIIQNYNPDVFYENDPATSSETAYTINKGTSMYFCIRSKELHQEFCDFDILLFAMLHEVSHIGTYDGWGHQVRFWEVFKFILLEAVECGIYHPQDYSKAPKDYCGLKVEYNPLFDDHLKDIRPSYSGGPQVALANPSAYIEDIIAA